MSVASVLDDGALLTPDAVAQRLSVSRSMVYAEIKKGRLAALYVGRLPRVTETALREYLARCKGTQ